MLGDDALDGFDAFAALPFVALDREGQYLAEPVRRLQSTRLLAVEPCIHAGLRAAAVRWITGQLATAQPAERWRSMADLLHLVEHSQVRDAFFPADAPLLPVEAATPADLTEVLDISEARVGSEERQIIECRVEALPHRFNVARGARGEVLAFYVCASSEDGLAELAHADPLLACWCADVAARRPSGRVLFIRQLLARARAADRRHQGRRADDHDYDPQPRRTTALLRAAGRGFRAARRLIAFGKQANPGLCRGSDRTHRACGSAITG
jgi:hypothetical protein